MRNPNSFALLQMPGDQNNEIIEELLPARFVN
jgi:hypothetical protein